MWQRFNRQGEGLWPEVTETSLKTLSHLDLTLLHSSIVNRVGECSDI